MTRNVGRIGDANLPRWSLALLGLALAVSLGLPILLALAQPVASALGQAGWRAAIISAVLSVALAIGFLYRHAHLAGPAEAPRFDRRLEIAGGVAAAVVLLIFPAQMSVFALAWPPPETAEAYFDLLNGDRLVGLLSLDILLMADWIVLLVLWAGLYATLAPRARRTMLVAVSLVLISTIAYFISNTIFEMSSLSAQYSAASSSSERASTLAAGEAALATFEGPWFTASYILSGVAVTLASIVMWREARFGKLVGGIGVAYGLLQLVPPNAGTIGMAMSLASLPLMLAWLGMIAWKLLRPVRTRRARGRARSGSSAQQTIAGDAPDID
jgi:hypothetical protein